LTWDEDDPERLQLTRRQLSQKEVDENDFKAYIASSTSGSDSEDESLPLKSKKEKAASRDKLRALLLSGGDELPEGWAKGDEGEGDIDMEITFTPGLSGAKGDRDETTLERYQRKMKEKKKRRKEEVKTKGTSPEAGTGAGDDFFAAASNGESTEDSEEDEKGTLRSKRDKRRDKRIGKKNVDHAQTRVESTAEELALLAASDNLGREPKHFDMKAVVRAEKKKGKKRRKGKHIDDGDNDLQEDFSIDVKDGRFTAVHDDHAFAIDPSNPHFKKTKSMSALLEERSRRQRTYTVREKPVPIAGNSASAMGSSSLKSLVESVKRKSAAVEQPQLGKRRKL